MAAFHRKMTASLALAIAMASDIGRAEPNRVRDPAIADLYDRAFTASLEQYYLRTLSTLAPDEKVDSIVATNAAQPASYMWAARQSFARMKAASAAGDREAASRQFTATAKYLALALPGLEREVKEDESAVVKANDAPFAIRRAPSDEAIFLASLKQKGLDPQLRKRAIESGYTERELDEYVKEILASPPQQAGSSIIEILNDLAKVRRDVLAALQTLVRTPVLLISGKNASTFVVANPHSGFETIDLLVRRVSIPPDWDLTIADAASTDGAAPPPGKRVEEVVPGEHYRVRLAGGEQIRISSAVVPAGEVGPNTTARWAVEGRIGDELIGGMMLEMNVPATIPDLQLPPIAAPPPRESLVQRMPLALWLAIGGLSVIAIGFLGWRFAGARRARSESSTSA